jgi:glycerol kinase
MERAVISIDAGTTGVTVRAVDRRGRVLRTAERDFRQSYPRPGWVEHDAEEIWRVTRGLLRSVAGDPAAIAAIGITNQRETVVVWERESGRPVAPAIVWQCRRTAPECERLKRRGLEPLVRRRTGLVLDPYFSATKLRWILDHDRPRGRLAFGTIDAWLLWNLTGGRVHATDVTNASRTLLYDIDRRAWSDEMLRLFRVPGDLLPEVRPSAGEFGRTERRLLGAEVPITGMAGDQQAALFGQGCVKPGSVKNTYGTGCFLVFNTGSKRVNSRHGLITTLACGADGGPVYALEGSVFVAGAAMHWLRDGLGLVRGSEETGPIAESVDSTGGVYVVPAFAGLGAPYWDPEARGLICGLTRGSGRAEIVRAALESIAYQTRDVVEAMQKDAGVKIRELRVDGGAASNDFLMQFQADLLGVRIIRPENLESTSLGAARLAALAVGLDLKPPTGGRVFSPSMSESRREQLYAGWKRAVARSRQNSEKRSARL